MVTRDLRLCVFLLCFVVPFVLSSFSCVDENGDPVAWWVQYRFPRGWEGWSATSKNQQPQKIDVRCYCGGLVTVPCE